MTRPVGSVGNKYRADFQTFCRLEARGFSSEEIIKFLWGTEKGDAKYTQCRNRLSMWRNNPEYNKIWLEELGLGGRRMLAKGIRKIREQIDCDQPWLANKAANDAVNFAKPLVLGENEKTVTVKIEGMPDLGTPDQQE